MCMRVCTRAYIQRWNKLHKAFFFESNNNKNVVKVVAHLVAIEITSAWSNSLRASLIEQWVLSVFVAIIYFSVYRLRMVIQH